MTHKKISFKHNCLPYLAIFTATLCLFGCKAGKKLTAVEEGNRHQILHLASETEPENLDPHIVTGVPEWRILLSLFEGLVNLEGKDLTITPGVAHSWNIAPNGLQYTFFLRNNARWSNGDPLTAHDFVFSYQRLLTPAFGGRYAYMLYPIVNAKKYNLGEIHDFSQVGVKALDSHTLQIDLEHPVPYLLSLLNHFAWLPVHKASILAHGSISDRNTSWTRPESFVGNGPFTLKRWVMNKIIVVEKNPHYWDYDNVLLNALHFHTIEDGKTQERAFLTGQLHLTTKVPLASIKKLKQDPRLVIGTYFANYAYLFNTKRAPFNDLRIRKAFSLAIDRSAITTNVSQKGELPAFWLTPPNCAGYQTSARLEENVKKAQELMADAGYPGGIGFPKISLYYNTSDIHKPIAEALQHMWKANLGVNVELINQEWKVYLAARSTNAFDLIRFGWQGDYLDPSSFLELFTSNSGNNFSGWTNPAYDQLIHKAENSLETSKRYAYFDEAEKILMEEIPVLPIFFYTTAYLEQPSVKNWYTNLLDVHNYKSVYLEN